MDGRKEIKDPQQTRDMVSFDAKLESVVECLLRAQAGDKKGQCNVGLHRQELEAHYKRFGNESLRWFNSELLPLIHGTPPAQRTSASLTSLATGTQDTWLSGASFTRSV